jgi:hypothetical protein
MTLEDADGNKTMVWPKLYAVVTDWQEGCVAAGTKSGVNTQCPCHSCFVLCSQLSDLEKGREARPRTEEEMTRIYNMVIALHKKGGCGKVIEQLTKDYSVNPVQVCGAIGFQLFLRWPPSAPAN